MYWIDILVLIVFFIILRFIGYFVFDLGKQMLEEGLNWQRILLVTLPAGSVIFQSYILITEVILSNDDDAPLSGGLEIAAFVVYGITALIIGGLVALRFSV